MSRRFPLIASLIVLAAACSDPGVARSYKSSSLSRATDVRRDKVDPTVREYGPSVKVGNGIARTYVVVDKSSDTPIELGVALSEAAMEGLPARDPHAAHKAAASAHEHVDNHVYLLSLPQRGVAPFQFVELDWNPGGHEPATVYDTAHFDFHFYTIAPAERAAIVPSDAQFQKKADMLPPEAQRLPFYVVAAPPGAPAPGVPLMGVHWVDVRSPELQRVFGKPEAYRDFTTTFLFGSWEGRVTFLEPMITRAYIIAKKTAIDPAMRDQVIPVPTPGAYGQAGYYPSAYRIAWDSQAKEYRIALTQLARRN